MKFDKNKEYALALSGGGVRGAYEAGVIKALREDNVNIKAVCGTSIGALNAALLAMEGSTDEIIEAWKKITPDTIYNNDDGIINKIRDISKLEGIINKNIDTKVLKNSGIDWGVVTVNLSNMKPLVIFKDKMEEEKIIDYILASSNYPTFYRKDIDGDKFIDGGIYDNLPSKPLYERGYKNIIEVDINPPLSYITKKGTGKDAEVHYITSKHSLLGQFLFSNEDIIENIKKGYMDTKLYNEDYISSHFYVYGPEIDIGINKKDIKALLDCDIINSFIDNDIWNGSYIRHISNFYNERNGSEDEYIPLKDSRFFVSMLEITAAVLGVNSLVEYEYDEFVEEILKQEKIIVNKSKKISIKNLLSLVSNKKLNLLKDDILAVLYGIGQRFDIIYKILYRTNPEVIIAYITLKILNNRVITT